MCNAPLEKGNGEQWSVRAPLLAMSDKICFTVALHYIIVSTSFFKEPNTRLKYAWACKRTEILRKCLRMLIHFIIGVIFMLACLASGAHLK
jgi:hypothetical protein